MTENGQVTSVNVYCDESCYMQHDVHKCMVLGALACPTSEVPRIAQALRAIKARHGMAPQFELKWTKVSPGRLDMYKEVVELFLSEQCMEFRAVVVQDKTKLVHDTFRQTHDEWYYKMYYVLLKELLARDRQLRVYLDYKDTRGGRRVSKLGECLGKPAIDMSAPEARIQIVRSHETQLLPLADVLIGAVSFANRGGCSTAKTELVALLRRQFGSAMTSGTPRSARKFNVFPWQGQNLRGGVSAT